MELALLRRKKVANEPGLGPFLGNFVGNVEIFVAGHRASQQRNGKIGE
jgi:hypothetical protein